jgi:hypothetical protein
MPYYDHLARQEIDFDAIQARVDSMAMLGVPYGEAVERASEMARDQALAVAREIEGQAADPNVTAEGLKDKKVVALIAYLQRLGVDITRPAPGEEITEEVGTDPTLDPETMENPVEPGVTEEDVIDPKEIIEDEIEEAVPGLGEDEGGAR